MRSICACGQSVSRVSQYGLCGLAVPTKAVSDAEQHDGEN